MRTFNVIFFLFATIAWKDVVGLPAANNALPRSGLFGAKNAIPNSGLTGANNKTPSSSLTGANNVPSLTGANEEIPSSSLNGDNNTIPNSGLTVSNENILNAGTTGSNNVNTEISNIVAITTDSIPNIQSSSAMDIESASTFVKEASTEAVTQVVQSTVGVSESQTDAVTRNVQTDIHIQSSSIFVSDVSLRNTVSDSLNDSTEENSDVIVTGLSSSMATDIIDSSMTSNVLLTYKLKIHLFNETWTDELQDINSQQYIDTAFRYRRMIEQVHQEQGYNLQKLEFRSLESGSVIAHVTVDIIDKADNNQVFDVQDYLSNIEEALQNNNISSTVELDNEDSSASINGWLIALIVIICVAVLIILIIIIIKCVRMHKEKHTIETEKKQFDNMEAESNTYPVRIYQNEAYERGDEMA